MLKEKISEEKLQVKNKYFTKYEIYLLVLLILIDQFLKILIDNYLVTGEVILNNFIFQITKIYNPGVSFSFLANKTILILVISLVALVFLVSIKKSYHQVSVNFGITLIIAGALGNLLDRINYGYVVDYINLTIFKFPIFNFADILITCGFIIIILGEVYNYLYKVR